MFVKAIVTMLIQKFYCMQHLIIDFAKRNNIKLVLVNMPMLKTEIKVLVIL